MKVRQQRIDRIADVDLRAAIGDAARQVGRELVSQRDAAADPRIGVFGEDAVVIVAAQPQADLRIEQVRVGEGDHVPLHRLRAGRGGDARRGLQAEPLPARRASRAVADVFPTRWASGVQSKFCSSKTTEPTKPASELIPTPTIMRPVIASWAVMSKGSSRAGSPPSGGPPRNGEFSLKIGPGM